MTIIDNPVLASRATSRKLNREQLRREAIHRSRMRRYHTQGDWPLDALTLTPANLEPGDVCMPMPPEPPPLEDYKARAADPRSILDDDPDPNLVIARHYERQRERAAAAALRGPTWTVDIVDARLERAFEVSLSWTRGGPRAFGSTMPKAMSELSDLVAQAQNQELRKAMTRLLRRRVTWSAADEAQAAEAIGWTADYLAGWPDGLVPMFVNAGAMWRVTRIRIARACDDLGVTRTAFYRKRRIGLEAIAGGLTRDGRTPT